MKEMMFNITNLEGNVNQNHNKILSYTSYQKTKDKYWQGYREK